MPDDPDKRLARRPRPVSGPVEDYESPDDDPDAPSEEDVARFSDVTVKCPECGTELFDDVAVCWKCGRALGAGTADESSIPVWVIIAAVVAVAAMLVFTFY